MRILTLPVHIFQAALAYISPLRDLADFNARQNAADQDLFPARGVDFMTMISSTVLAWKSASLSAYFSSGWPVMKSQNLFLVTEGACAHPVGRVGQALGVWVLFRLEHAKEAMLADSASRWAFCDCSMALSRAVMTWRGGRSCRQNYPWPALDQRFQNTLVEQAQVDAFAEVEDGSEAAFLRTSLDDGIDGVTAHVFDSSKAEADGLAVRSKVRVADVDVREARHQSPFRGTP